jgi:hypothetical protein
LEATVFKWLRSALVALGLIAALASAAFMQNGTSGDIVSDRDGEWIWDTDPNP